MMMTRRLRRFIFYCAPFRSPSEPMSAIDSNLWRSPLRLVRENGTFDYFLPLRPVVPLCLAAPPVFVPGELSGLLVEGLIGFFVQTTPQFGATRM